MPKDVTIHIRTTAEIKALAEKLAIEDNRSVTQLIEQLIRKAAAKGK